LTSFAIFSQHKERMFEGKNVRNGTQIDLKKVVFEPKNRLYERIVMTILKID